jgi:hypothetical protein
MICLTMAIAAMAKIFIKEKAQGPFEVPAL